ncbi:hypothetical protein [Enterocloster bolteae]|jgi:hypothetical protein|uniref:hypothetical protein n=1 Tax=Enterocloster bolteae TaxID=208479 RepID=UPI00189EE44E|nr:hypothetical protein [Enterocloster bolteae]DAZ06446.1 MAG TPA: Protein of unknown function (DUF2612) [Caudoviricetes sp.]
MRLVERLPDCYRKDEDSNNHKLLELERLATEELRLDIKTVLDSLDLNQANGNTLDLYGDMLGQRRGLLNDEQYRYMILARIGRNVVQGDYNSVMSTLILMFGSQAGDITLDDLEVVEGERPCVVRLTKFPVYVLINAGFSSRQAVAMIESLLPVCVTLSADNFEGTFEFADTADVYDEQAGFGNIGQTIGGYLGLYLGDDDKIPVLPI